MKSILLLLASVNAIVRLRDDENIMLSAGTNNRILLEARSKLTQKGQIVDLDDDPVSLEMNQYADTDVDNFIRPMSGGDTFVRFDSEPDHNLGGFMAQTKVLSNVEAEKDIDDVITDADYNDGEILKSVK